MKIALYHNLTSGGSKREAYEFAKRFVAAGHTVHLFYPTTANEQFLPLSEIVHQAFTFPLQLVPPLPGRLPGVRKYLDLIGLITNLVRLKTVAQHIAQDIDRERYDFVFIHHDRIVQSPYLLRYLQTPSVYYCAEPMRTFYESSPTRPYHAPQSFAQAMQQRWYLPAQIARRAIVKAEDRKNVQQASLLLTNSFFSAENIYRAYGLRARVVYLGVDTSKFRPLELPQEDFVLSVGAVSPYKGYDFLVEAAAHIPLDQRPRLVIVGNTASRGERRFLEQSAAEQKVQLEILINVSEEQLVRLYNQAQAYVYAPILEPFGLTPVEAMACGTPVVGVKEGGVRESVTDNETGLLVERVPAIFAEALVRLRSDVTLRETFGRNGHQRVTNFWTFEQAYQRLVAVLNQHDLSFTLRETHDDILTPDNSPKLLKAA